MRNFVIDSKECKAKDVAMLDILKAKHTPNSGVRIDLNQALSFHKDLKTLKEFAY